MGGLPSLTALQVEVDSAKPAKSDGKGRIRFQA